MCLQNSSAFPFVIIQVLESIGNLPDLYGRSGRYLKIDAGHNYLNCKWVPTHEPAPHVYPTQKCPHMYEKNTKYTHFIRIIIREVLPVAVKKEFKTCKAI